MITSAWFWIVLLVAVPVYWLVPRRLRMGLLAALSFAYLASVDWLAPLVMLGLSLVVFRAAPEGGRARPGWLVPGLVLGLLAYLCWVKYSAALAAAAEVSIPAAGFIAPIGVSYFTFKLIHYVVESGRGNLPPRSLDQFLCYVFLYPIFTGGPIERYDHFTRQEQRWEIAHLTEGLTRIAFGLIKRFLLAEAIRQVLGGEINAWGILRELPDWAPYELWGYFLLVFLFHYLDFSALADIAIGASRLFGIRIMENFRWPILARNVSEFWKRWHMTLVGWCQAYVYMPLLGLTRRPYVCVYATFITMGLWHAGSLHWVCWGTYHATGVAVHLTWNRIKRVRGWTSFGEGRLSYLGIPFTLLYISGGSIFPAMWGQGSVEDAFRILAKFYCLGGQ